MKSFLSEKIELPAEVGLFRPEPDARLGRDLKGMYDRLVKDPMPDHLLRLADALEEAFERGELFDPRMRLDS